MESGSGGTPPAPTAWLPGIGLYQAESFQADEVRLRGRGASEAGFPHDLPDVRGPPVRTDAPEGLQDVLLAA